MPPPLPRPAVSVVNNTTNNSLTIKSSSIASDTSNGQVFSVSTPAIAPQRIPDAGTASSTSKSHSTPVNVHSHQATASSSMSNGGVVSGRHAIVPAPRNGIMAPPASQESVPRSVAASCVTSTGAAPTHSSTSPQPPPYMSFQSATAPAVTYSQHLYPQIASSSTHVSQPMPTVIHRPPPSTIPIAPFPPSQVSLQQLCRAFPSQRHVPNGTIGMYPGTAPSGQTMHSFQPKFLGNVSRDNNHAKTNGHSSSVCSQTNHNVSK